jgi:hypothetical protein
VIVTAVIISRVQSRTRAVFGQPHLVSVIVTTVAVMVTVMVTANLTLIVVGG